MVKVYYFDIFGKAEPIRMLLSKAGVPFEDVRLTDEMLAGLKAEGVLDFGQVPMVELDDGTKLCQTNAILGYLAHLYGFKPEDPFMVYWGEAILTYYEQDFIQKHLYSIYFAADEETKAKNLETFLSTHAPKFLDHFGKRLTKGKFICGDKLTWYDFVVTGMWVNLAENPLNPVKDLFANMLETKSSDRVK